MKKILLLCLVFGQHVVAQTLAPLTVEKIMKDPKWMGTQPSAPQWSVDGQYLFFKWNPDQAPADSLYYISTQNSTPQKAGALGRTTVMYSDVTFNPARTAYTYIKDGDVFLGGSKTVRITQTTEFESNPRFAFGGTKLVYSRNQNLFAWDIASGATSQLTNFVKGTAPKEEKKETAVTQDKWLADDAVAMSQVLQRRKTKRELGDSIQKKLKPKELRSIYTDDKMVQAITISPDGRFVTYRLLKAATGGKTTIIPNYVTETGYTTDINGRTNVGEPQGTMEMFVWDTDKDTVLPVKTDSLPGIKDLPDYAKDYPVKDTTKNKKPATRAVSIQGPYWNEKGSHAIVNIYSQDNKDRWIALLDGATGKLSVVDRQRDEAWIGGPVAGRFGGSGNVWIDENVFWFQSEASGYAHLYTYNVTTQTKTARTSGNYEVQSVQLSAAKKFFYITTNEVHPGEQHYYRLPVTGGKAEKLTAMTGANQPELSPDEKQFAFLYSYSNKPWELYLQKTQPGSAKQITDQAQSALFKSYAWRDPEVITFKAEDGADVHARLYKPASPHASKPAVIFVHGAGYLQNAHKWWSSYFREYMFHNLLVDNGYTVLDIDYRGSAGYGRDWRTGIYRYMGGKDLSDHVDGAKYLVQNLGIDPKRIGIYGGSYGGFITLMAMFTKPGTFEAGAALRSVTDWAHYNHGYTSNILNEPVTDSIAYKKSSPIYYAGGLQGHLLMCHGMVDVNVHFQDIVRLTQRLIELGKDNWELAVYPVEDHGFVEPESWTDEYKRIFKLFEQQLKK